MGKLKFTLQHPIQAQSKSTGITLTLFNLGTRRGVGGQRRALPALPAGQLAQYALSHY